MSLCPKFDRILSKFISTIFVRASFLPSAQFVYILGFLKSNSGFYYRMVFVYTSIHLLQYMFKANDSQIFSKFMNWLTSGANEPFPDAVVTIWRLDPAGRLPQTFISLAPLITPNYIFTLRKYIDDIRPLKTIGFCTGHNCKETKKMENSIIIDDFCVQQLFTILVVSISI